MHPRFLTVLAAVLATLAVPSTTSAQDAARAADHVVIVMLDGARADLLKLADMPNLTKLVAAGVTFTQARTIYPSQTRVAFVTLPTGAYGGSHGIIGGDYFKDANWETISLGEEPNPWPAQALIARATFFEEAAAVGLKSIYAAMKGYELVGARGATFTINGNRTLDQAAYATRYDRQVNGSAALALWNKQLLSRQLLDQTLALFREHRPAITIVNLGSADYTAHSFGPQTPQYRESLQFLDGLLGELVKAVDDAGLRERTTFIISSDHGFSHGDGRTMVARGALNALELPNLTSLGIENFVTNNGGTALGVYIRDKTRVAEAAAALRREPWTDAIFCEEPAAQCDRTLHELHAYFPGRSPDLAVDLDDDATVNRPRLGSHGSLRSVDMLIPLVLSGAGIAQGVVAGRAELVDVAPTVMRLLGLEMKAMRPDGRVLDEALSGKKMPTPE
jgi:arylsulfatase A-like enzyme